MNIWLNQIYCLYWVYVSVWTSMKWKRTNAILYVFFICRPLCVTMGAATTLMTLIFSFFNVQLQNFFWKEKASIISREQDFSFLPHICASVLNFPQIRLWHYENRKNPNPFSLRVWYCHVLCESLSGHQRSQLSCSTPGGEESGGLVILSERFFPSVCVFVCGL